MLLLLPFVSFHLFILFNVVGVYPGKQCTQNLSKFNDDKQKLPLSWRLKLEQNTHTNWQQQALIRTDKNVAKKKEKNFVKRFTFRQQFFSFTTFVTLTPTKYFLTTLAHIFLPDNISCQRTWPLCIAKYLH